MHTGSRFLFVFLVLLATVCNAETTYPNMPAVAQKYANGVHGLTGWHSATDAGARAPDRIVPDDSVFNGAVSWSMQVDEQDLRKVTLAAAKSEGFTVKKFLAVTPIDWEKTLAYIEPDPDGEAVVVMLEGNLGSTPARGIMLVWYGKYGLAKGAAAVSSVYAFIAPTPVFEALGGPDIPGVRVFDATTEPDSNMLGDGNLIHAAATQKLALFFHDWVAVRKLGTNMSDRNTMYQSQTIHYLQNWNGELSSCAGNADCGAVPDGYDDFEAE